MSKPRRILMTADTVGGVWTYAMELARGLSAQGVEVVLAAMGGPVSEAQRREAVSVPGLELHESAFRLEWMDEPWEDVDAAAHRLLDLSRSRAVDLVHLNGYCHGNIAWDAPVLVVAHSCVVSWWDAVKGGRAPARYDEYRRRVRQGLESADLIVAPSGSFRQAFAQCWEFDATQIRIIYNGRDPGLFPAARKEPFVFCAGRIWDEGKNLGLLADIDLGEYELLMAGDGSGTASRGFLGKLNTGEVAMWMSRAGVFASPAKYEPFGLSVLEAAMSGCALALGDIPTMRELWSDAALFLPVDDADAWREGLIELLISQTDREELGARARARALDFQAGRMVDQYLEAYGQLMESTPLEVEEALEVAG